jgi:chromosome segregation ATPase
MTIPSVIQGLIKTEDGNVFELDSSKGSAWLEAISSFRFKPSSDSKPYTVRKESGIYWYGCRKIAGKVRKKYIGKSSEVTVVKLEEIAKALEIPPVPRANKVAEVAQVTEKVAEVTGVTEKVAQVAEKVAGKIAEVAQVTEKVAEVAQDRLTALELQVANLQKAVEALQKALSGKLESSDSLELPKVDNEVAERLQNELGNLKNENEALRQELAKEKENYGTLAIISQPLNEQLEEVKAERAKLLESSTHVTNKLRQEVQELRLQLETERASREEIEAELSELKQNSVPAAKLSEKLASDAATILSQLRARRKKSKTDLADLEAILEILES